MALTSLFRRHASLVLVLIMMSSAALGIAPGKRVPLRNFDKRKPDSVTAIASPSGVVPFAAAPAKRAAAARLRARIRDLEIDQDAIVGTPKFIRARRGFLTGPNGTGPAISTGSLAAIPAGDKQRVIKAFLNEHSALFGHDASALQTARIRRDYVTAHNGLHTMVWEQQLDGISIFEALLEANVTSRSELVSIGSQFVSDPAGSADKGLPGRHALQGAPPINARQAISNAAAAIEEQIPKDQIANADLPQGAELAQTFSAPGLNGAKASLVWLPTNDSTLRLCWEVVLTSKARGELFRVLVDASTGEALVRHCLTNYISDATYNVYTSDSPSPFSPGHPTPSSVQPPLVPRTLVTIQAFNPTASPNGWINDGVTETLGNNVDAHTDTNNDNLPDLPRPQATMPGRVFDFPLDLTLAPSTYKDAAVTQLFYLCNWIHDRFYELGFTEPAGNFQTDNFGRGGIGGDPVQADAQDGSGSDNANFSTPPDGSSGRMQMYVFTGPTPYRDGDLDAEIVIHEHTHGLSNRLVGGGVGISALQTAGMGEGWSDFYALCLLSDPADDPNANYVEGGYATYQLGGLTQNYYYGIRRYPYTTDPAKNPLTFKDLDPGQASSHPGVPHSPIIGDTADEVHNQGELWCNTLWQARANLIAKLGGAAGNQLILELVTDGMKLSPANPNFLQARDAILLADQVKTGGANRLELWAAFAKRGMGATAKSPDSSTTAGVLETFDMPDVLTISPTGPVTVSGPPAGPFTPAVTTYTLENTDAAPLNWTAGSQDGWFRVSPNSGTLAAGASTTVTVTIDTIANSLPAGNYTGKVTFTNVTSGAVLPRSVKLIVSQSTALTELFSATNPNDTHNLTFTFTPDASPAFYHLCQTTASVFPSDPTGSTNVTLTDDSNINVALTGGALVSLYGTTYNSVYIGSNGYVTFTVGDNTYSTTLANHFNLPRVSALFDDLNPGTGGSISYRQQGDRFVATYQNVPQYGTTNQNSFQIELFFDGRIRITFLALADTKSLVGLSRGLGVPSDFTTTNFSAAPVCGTELPNLTMSLPATANETAGTLNNQGSISIPTALASSLTVSLASSDTSELTVPAEVTIDAGNTSASFDLTLVNDTIADGTRTVRVDASATGYNVGSRAIKVTDDETATLTVTAPASAREGDGLLVGQGHVSLDAPAVESVLVSLNSNDTTEVQVPSLVIIPAGESTAPFDITVVDDTAVDGTQNAVITASVTNWPAASAPMAILDNDPPIVTVAATDADAAEAGANTGTFTVTRVDDLSRPLTVAYAMSGTATNGNDYATLTGTVTIPINAATKTITLSPIADNVMEGPETAIFTVQPNASYVVGSPSAATVLIAPDAGPGTGILRQWFTGISGTTVASLTSNAAYPNSPTGSVTVTNLFEVPTNFGDNYGTRMRGYFIPPATGSYIFYIASDDNSQLFLGTDSTPANAVKIAEVTNYTSSRQWTKYTSQKSAAKSLVGGEWYYIEALHKEGGGGDNLAVGVEMPEGYLERPILANRLQPWGASKPVVTITATDPVAAETGTDTGTFQITRAGLTNAALVVQLSASGSATSGSDYAAISTTAVIPAGSASTTITVTPVPDNLSEGSETVLLTVQPDPAYTVGAASAATVTIKDKPADEWRFSQFGGNIPLSGDAEDFDHDGISNLLERALNMDPKASSVALLPSVGMEAGHLSLTYTRLKNAPDLTYKPEVAGSLSGPWLSGPANVTESLISEDAQTQTIKAVDTGPDSGESIRFIRLNISVTGP